MDLQDTKRVAIGDCDEKRYILLIPADVRPTTLRINIGSEDPPRISTERRGSSMKTVSQPESGCGLTGPDNVATGRGTNLGATVDAPPLWREGVGDRLRPEGAVGGTRRLSVRGTWNLN